MLGKSVILAIFLRGSLPETDDQYLMHTSFTHQENMSVQCIPIIPHFYIVKIVYTGVYIFLFLLQNIDCGYLLEPPHRGSSNMYPQSMF